MDMRIEPSSKRLNAEDFLSGPRTFAIRDLRPWSGDDGGPVAVYLEGEARPFLPCLTMRRMMVLAWGDPRDVDYKGRMLRLYRDPSVRFGKDQPGGVRISHMSHIDAPVEAALSVTRGRRALTRVEPLRDGSGRAALPAPARKELVRAGQQAAEKGTEELRRWWESLPPGEDKRVLSGQMPGWKKRAEEVDANGGPNPFGLGEPDPMEEAAREADELQRRALSGED
jgi:hypothetical protein